MDEISLLASGRLTTLGKTSDQRFQNAMDTLVMTMRLEFSDLGTAVGSLRANTGNGAGAGGGDLKKVQHIIALIVTMRGEVSTEAVRGGTMLDDPSFHYLEEFMAARKCAGSPKDQVRCRIDLITGLARQAIPIIRQRTKPLRA